MVKIWNKIHLPRYFTSYTCFGISDTREMFSSYKILFDVVHDFAKLN